MYFKKIKNCCAANDAIKNVKRQLTKWGRCLRIVLFDKRLEIRVYKLVSQLNKIIQTGKESTRTFLQRGYTNSPEGVHCF